MTESIFHIINFPNINFRATDPKSTLMVRDGRLYKNNLAIGHALEIFDHLTLPPSANFFPAWIGFFFL